MSYIYDNGELVIFPEIISIYNKYENYIVQNIKNLITDFNPKIVLHNDFRSKKLPDFIKNIDNSLNGD